MSSLTHPQTMTIDGPSIRFVDGGAGSQAALLLSRWPERLFAFGQWATSSGKNGPTNYAALASGRWVRAT